MATTIQQHGRTIQTNSPTENARTVIINGTSLDIDPDRYRPFDGIRRGSVHPLVNGGTIFQDRGIKATDRIISFSGKLFNQATIITLENLYNQTGNTFPFVDFDGNEFTVIFTPGRNSFSYERIHGSRLGFTYEIEFRVISIQKRFGVAV